MSDQQNGRSVIGKPVWQVFFYHVSQHSLKFKKILL